MRCWVYWVYVELKLICLVEKTINTSLGDVSDNALIMIRMMTMEMLWLFTFHNTEFARATSLFASKARDSVYVILSEKSLVSLFNHTLCYEHDVNWMRKIGKDRNEGFSHFPSHVEILIFILEEIDGMWNLTVWSEMFHDLTVNEEEDLNFIFREISVKIFVVKFYGSVKERLPSLLWFGHFTDFNGMVENFLHFNVMSHFVVKINFILVQSSS